MDVLQKTQMADERACRPVEVVFRVCFMQKAVVNTHQSHVRVAQSEIVGHTCCWVGQDDCWFGSGNTRQCWYPVSPSGRNTYLVLWHKKPKVVEKGKWTRLELKKTEMQQLRRVQR